jgi:hypothetical protein
LEYIKDYDSNPEFEQVLQSHLLPQELLDWARMDKMPDDALDQFIEKRINLILEELKIQLQGINFEIIDTKEKQTIETYE